jgi:hypothetical protein
MSATTTPAELRWGDPADGFSWTAGGRRCDLLAAVASAAIPRRPVDLHLAAIDRHVAQVVGWLADTSPVEGLKRTSLHRLANSVGRALGELAAVYKDGAIIPSPGDGRALGPAADLLVNCLALTGGIPDRRVERPVMSVALNTAGYQPWDPADPGSGGWRGADGTSVPLASLVPSTDAAVAHAALLTAAASREDAALLLADWVDYNRVGETVRIHDFPADVMATCTAAARAVST